MQRALFRAPIWLYRMGLGGLLGRRPDHGLVGGALAALKGADAGSGVATSVRVSLLAGPNCDVILGWDPRAVPADWQRARGRYFRLNWLRAWLTWLACGCFWP